MKTSLMLTTLLGLACWAETAPGVRPRASSTDYPVQGQQGSLTIAAALLPPTQVKNQFATDLSRYAVVEVALYPGDTDTEISASDFSLRVGGQQTIVRAVAPQSIAGANTRHTSPPPKPSSPSDITLYPTATIGYESGPVYDPATGRNRGGGWYGGGGVGVGIGNTPGPVGAPGPDPQTREKNRETMRMELEDQSLPEGKINKPVAGYLYFPLPTDKRRNVAYELHYNGANGRVKLPFPAVK